MRTRTEIEKQIDAEVFSFPDRNAKLAAMVIELLLDIRESSEAIRKELETIRLRNSNGQGK